MKGAIRCKMKTTNKNRSSLCLAMVERMVATGVEVTTVALMLKVTRQTVHRWLGTGHILSDSNTLYKIEGLFDRYAEIRGDWTEIVVAWNGAYHRATLLTFCSNRQVRQILESDLSFDLKIQKCTALTFSEWARLGRR